MLRLPSTAFCKHSTAAMPAAICASVLRGLMDAENDATGCWNAAVTS
jgi:hypothetical protein